jgi:hypothetical protein
MRILATTVAYALSLALVAVGAFFVVLVLAGPHSDILPGWGGVIVLGLGWLAVLLLPAFASQVVWRRLAPSDN